MPHVTAPISPGGPILDLLVGVSLPRAEALRRLGQAVPDPLPIRGLIDTGASVTCIDPAGLHGLGLAPTGQVRIHTPSTGDTPHTCLQYDVSLVLLHPRSQAPLHAVPVICASLSSQGFHALIGRDVLARCLLVYDGPGGVFSLAF